VPPMRIHLIVAALAAIVVAALAALAGGADPAAARPHAGQNHEMVFFSNQLVPVAEAEQVRNVMLRNYRAHRVQFVPAASDRVFEDRILAEQQAGRVTISVIGGLHGNYVSLRARNVLMPLNDVATQLRRSGIPRSFMTLGKLGTRTQQYIPWMQATYVLVANTRALPLLPRGADRNRLTYGQFLQWARNIRQRFGVGRVGFPASDQGLFHRFLQGYFVPSFTGRNVTRWNSADAVTGWRYLKQLWPLVHPQSMTYGFMQDPLLNGEVMLAWEHVARTRTALLQRPQDFVVMPAPRGPKGRAFMPVLAGLAIPRGAPQPAAGKNFIRYMLSVGTQAQTLGSVGFYPVVSGRLSRRLGPGLLKQATAVKRTQNARDALPSLLPIGLGTDGGNFNTIYRNTFRRIVLNNEDIRTVLREEGNRLQAIFDRNNAPCWAPDPPSRGTCRVG
jgi:multiple sugar transport system substrate-binding protein